MTRSFAQHGMSPMQRVMIIGPGGAGKSTLARRLGASSGLPVTHLDALFWTAGWVPLERTAWQQRQRELVDGERWILDGNYGSTIDIRLERADTVIVLDLPRLLCLWRVIKRRFAYLAQTRPDMAAGCRERLTFQFLWWIWNFRRQHLPRLVAKLDALPPGTRVVTLRSRSDVAAFVAEDIANCECLPCD